MDPSVCWDDELNNIRHLEPSLRRMASNSNGRGQGKTERFRLPRIIAAYTHQACHP